MKHYRRDRLVAAGWEVRDGSSFLVEPGPVATARRALAAVQALDGWLSAHAADQPEVLGEVLGVLGAIDSAALAARVRTITAASTAEVAVADGQVSHAAWVAKVLGMTGTAARNECRTATELADSPEVLADLAAGRISRDQIAAVLAAARRQAADQEAAARARAAASWSAACRRAAASTAAIWSRLMRPAARSASTSGESANSVAVRHSFRAAVPVIPSTFATQAAWETCPSATATSAVDAAVMVRTRAASAAESMAPSTPSTSPSTSG